MHGLLFVVIKLITAVLTGLLIYVGAARVILAFRTRDTSSRRTYGCGTQAIALCIGAVSIVVIFVVLIVFL